MKNYLMLAVFLLVNGCAALQQAHYESLCTKNAAYQEGTNDAKNGDDMNLIQFNGCPNGGDQFAEQYKIAYDREKAQAPKKIVIETINETPYGGRPQTAYSCLEKYGRKVCGFDCKEAYGKIACGRTAFENCVVNFGEIKCGRNCKADFNQIKCDP